MSLRLPASLPAIRHHSEICVQDTKIVPLQKNIFYSRHRSVSGKKEVPVGVG